MKNVATLYYLLFVLLIMGAFASMAQNSYGITILGSAAVAFGLIFLYQFIVSYTKNAKMYVLTRVELFCLSLLSFMLALRIFHIHFPYVEWLFSITAAVLVVVYIKKMADRYLQFNTANKKLSRMVLFFHLSILFFIAALMLAPFLQQISVYAGGLGFLFLLLFLITAFINKSFQLNGEAVPVSTIIAGFKDRSILIISFFIIISLYTGLNRINVLPDLYSDDLPQAYYDLLNHAETGKEKSVKGKYAYEEFKQKYDQFLERNRLRDE